MDPKFWKRTDKARRCRLGKLINAVSKDDDKAQEMRKDHAEICEEDARECECWDDMNLQEPGNP